MDEPTKKTIFQISNYIAVLSRLCRINQSLGLDDSEDSRCQNGWLSYYNDHSPHLIEVLSKLVTLHNVDATQYDDLFSRERLTIVKSIEDLHSSPPTIQEATKVPDSIRKPRRPKRQGKASKQRSFEKYIERRNAKKLHSIEIPAEVHNEDELPQIVEVIPSQLTPPPTAPAVMADFKRSFSLIKSEQLKSLQRFSHTWSYGDRVRRFAVTKHRVAVLKYLVLVPLDYGVEEFCRTNNKFVQNLTSTSFPDERPVKISSDPELATFSRYSLSIIPKEFSSSSQIEAIESEYVSFHHVDKVIFSLKPLIEIISFSKIREKLDMVY